MQPLNILKLAWLSLSVTSALLIQIAGAQRSILGSSVLPLLELETVNLGCQLHPAPISEKRVSGNHVDDEDGERSLVEQQDFGGWMGGMRRFYTRVLHFQKGEPEPHWPKMYLGWRTLSAVVLGGLGAALSSAGGLGGGGLFVPLFNLLLQFDTKTSAALSNFMILGGSLMSLFINVQQHHPTLHHKHLIDYDVVLLLQPNMLLGISSGVILNVVLPGWVITALLTITLTYMTYHSCKGGLKRWKRESAIKCVRKGRSQSTPNEKAPESPISSSCDDYSSEDDDIPCVGGSAVVTHGQDEENQTKIVTDTPGFLQKTTKDEARAPLLHKEIPPLPVDTLIALAVTWFAFFVIQVLRGGKGSESIVGVQACGLGYWLLTATQIPLALGVTAWTVNRLRAAHSRIEHPESIQEDGFSLRPESCLLLAWMAFIAGLLGGMLGIGGGMIVNPLLLTVGMVPQVTSGTCASMVFFSSSMSVVQFALMGRVPVGYALTAAVLCSAFSFVGITVVHRAIRKYNRESLIVFSVATVMGLSAVLMAGFGGLGIWRDYESGAYMGFNHLC